MSARRFKIAFLLLILLKLFLDYLPVMAVNGGYDDQLFVRLGSSIAAGHWLGKYDQLTLAKGPGLSMFMALCNVVRLPLSLADPLLYVLFCIILARSMEPVIGKKWGPLILFAVLLFNPLSFGVDDMARVLRERIYPALCGIVLASAIGLYLRRNQPIRRLRPWAVALGVSIGAYWITREEGVWLWPSLALLIVAGAVRLVRARPPQMGKRAVMLAMPLALGAGLVGSVAAINFCEYGRFLIVEFKDPAFVAAYGAMSRVDPAARRRFVPVSSAALRMMYAVSPAAAELRPYFDGPDGQYWRKFTQQRFHTIKGEIGTAWFSWALRQAVAAAGHARSAADAQRFYARLAAAINAACDSGRLPAGPPRDTLVPPISLSDLPKFIYTVRHAVRLMTHYHRFIATVRPSLGPPATIKEFHDLVGGAVAPTANSAARLPRLLPFRLAVIGAIIRIYGLITPAISYISAAIFVLLLLGCASGRPDPVCLIAAVYLLAAFSMIAIMGLYSVTTYPDSICPLYLSAAYPPMLVFDVLLLLQLPRLFRRLKLNRQPAAGSKVEL